MEFHIERAKVLPKANLHSFISGLKKWGKLIAPVRKGEKFVFTHVEKPEEVELNYTRTILPPKKFLVPYRRERFSYSVEDLSFKTNFKAENQVIFGIHSCDLHGISILDSIYLKENPDPRYLEVRKRTVLIGVSCVPDEFCFCLATATAFPEGASWDLFLTDIGADYFVSIGSPKGDEIVYSQRSLFRDIEKEDLNAYKATTLKKKSLFKPEQLPDLERISHVVELEYDSEVWQEEAKRCLGCGTCTNVCPTCFCYTSVDVPNIAGTEVKRIEFTTSCQYPYYSLVAGGHYFKATRADRFKHRYYHKLVGYPYQVEMLGCVGCGRCSAECPASISMVETIKRLRGCNEKELREVTE
ncbi:cytochrome-c3 hydrogenase alpha chain [Thermovibrio ammonificans HB-1]|uniref:Cytochrome-c3 hydrogenase alpha chain n=1 Tax=Thermovibrio ammonificans (strain DSM 15698 / JCM 12110 / HB-1) TaxID=648996 RepID=E8T5C1_THEA1|nr:4Fe-4S dicluster domain-containing protein [Thermovibrio ammonificans]ADU96459.1 cytochrome-c3 hydrogenase alpha chain [Thermovibrio ammonificans HB-1]